MTTKNCNTAYIQREFCSHQTLSRPICAGFSSIFSQSIGLNESQFNIPSQLGCGSSRRVRLGDSIEICFNDMKLCQDIQLSGKTQGDAYVLMFCLGEDMIWRETNSRQTMELGKNSGVLYHVRDIDETAIYEKNRHYQGITLTFHPRKFLDYFSPFEEQSIFTKRLQNYEYTTHPLPSKAKIILTEALRCSYSGNLRALYLEGKALELLAVCVSAITEKHHISDDFIKLSKIDSESIALAKDLLDSNISSPITIAALARSVCLNESKLKKGFKYIYGKPVYSYLLDKRMETARMILETQHVTISEVAEYVGYESSSSFSKAFHKRFGFYPSDCAIPLKAENNGLDNRNTLLDM